MYGRGKGHGGQKVPLDNQVGTAGMQDAEVTQSRPVNCGNIRHARSREDRWSEEKSRAIPPKACNLRCDALRVGSERAGKREHRSLDERLAKLQEDLGGMTHFLPKTQQMSRHPFLDVN